MNNLVVVHSPSRKEPERSKRKEAHDNEFQQDSQKEPVRRGHQRDKIFDVTNGEASIGETNEGGGGERDDLSAVCNNMCRRKIGGIHLSDGDDRDCSVANKNNR